MDYNIFEILCGIIALLLAIYYYFTSTYHFWKSRRIPGPEPILFLGNFKDIFLNKLSLGDYLTKLYNEYKDSTMFGIFIHRTPILVIKDPELIKTVLIKDFSIFADRGILIFEKIEPLSQHLFALEPKRWKPLRSKLSPAFSSGKLKEMFYLLLECADHLEEFLAKYTKNHSAIDVRELAAKFTTDVIGVCAFGLKMNSIAEEDSHFRRIGRKILQPSRFHTFKIRIKEAIPWLYQLLAPIVYNYQVNNFFIKSFKNTMEYRRKNNFTRNDFVDLLMHLKDNPNEIGGIEMTDSFITAQVFVFFIAGFETSSTTMSYALYELALNQCIQDKLRQEINEKFDKNNKILTYDTIQSMKYLNKVFCETLRKYPPVPILMRKSMQSYTFANTDITIPEGTKVFIPAYAIHHDPELYPDPELFDPERFDDENEKNRQSSIYLPFGDGPRNCIGARFAKNQTKVGLIKILKNYKIEFCGDPSKPLQNHPNTFMLSPVEAIQLKFVPII